MEDVQEEVVYVGPQWLIVGEFKRKQSGPFSRTVVIVISVI